MEIVVGYIAALVIGITLGLIGGGGSIVTVPVLVYLLHVEPVLATSYSLFIVGVASIVGAYPKNKHGNVDFRLAAVFGGPSIVTIFLTRKFLVPLIPSTLIHIGSLEITKPVFMLLLFAMLMLLAAFAMITNSNNGKYDFTKQARPYRFTDYVGHSIGVGLLAGLVGAGGGFLIIPVLVSKRNIPMKKAIGTSLVIIAANSLIGFTGDLKHTTINWTFLLFITALAVGGIIIGNKLSTYIDGQKLKKGFGWFILAMGISILCKELIFYV
jgi:uncharacterized membrane protein YfcA